MTGRTFPADEVMWGIAIRNGFDELDDPWYHRGTTQHAYLEGNDNVAICGFQPPQSGPRTRRRSRLGLPTPGEHPMCGICARMVVAPRPRVPVPVQPARPAVTVPVSAGGPRPVAAATMVAPRDSVAPQAAGNGATPRMPSGGPGRGRPGPAIDISPWVRRTGQGDHAPGAGPSPGDGLLGRGIHTEFRD